MAWFPVTLFVSIPYLFLYCLSLFPLVKTSHIPYFVGSGNNQGDSVVVVVVVVLVPGSCPVNTRFMFGTIYYPAETSIFGDSFA